MVNENLTQLLSKLRVQSTKDEFAKVEETCMKLLGDLANKEDHGAILKAYLVATIKQDRYAQAARVLVEKKNIDEQYGDQFALEKLYIFYKLNEVEKFESLYKQIVPEPENFLSGKSEEELTPLRGVLHVRAQFCYNNAHYDEAFEIYHYLATHNEKMIDNDIELACNERVPLTVQPHLQSDITLSTVSEESYDLLFNDSMVLSAKGQFNEAIELLQKAHKMATSDGYESDVNAIELQLSYVYQMMGRSKDSQELLSKLIGKLDQGSPLALLAKMNRKTFCDYSKFKTNLNLVLREINAEALTGYNLKHYTQAQWAVIHRNILFLHLFNNDSIQFKSTPLARTLHNYRKIVDDVNLESYQSQAKKLYHRAIKMLSNKAQDRDPNVGLLGFLLLTLQLLVTEKQWDNAIRLCMLVLKQSENIPEADRVHGRNTIYCILLQLRRRTGWHAETRPQQSNYESEVSDESLKNDIAFWKSVGMYYLEKKPAFAIDLFKRLSKLSDDELINQYISVEASEVDLSEATRFTQGIDVEALLAAGAVQSQTKKKSNVFVLSKVTKGQQKRIALKKQKQKEQRLKKFLDSHDVSKTPDPERWLPKKDRSSFRPKKKQIAKQTQGGNMNKKAEQALDISKKIKAPKKGKNKRK